MARIADAGICLKEPLKLEDPEIGAALVSPQPDFAVVESLSELDSLRGRLADAPLGVRAVMTVLAAVAVVHLLRGGVGRLFVVGQFFPGHHERDYGLWSLPIRALAS
jgi:hypothetical protein